MTSRSTVDRTSKALVEAYEECAPQLFALQTEIRELAKKKPETTLSKNKVSLINRVLRDIQGHFSQESGGKYLQLLDEETLPQLSDAVLIIAQFSAVLSQFKDRYHRWNGTETDWHTK
jgi:hypothetical protein